MSDDTKKIDPKTWCPYPSFNLNSNTDGRVKLCCSITENLHVRDGMHTYNFGKDRIEDIWNSNYMNAARHSLSSGIQFSHCSNCWKMEEMKIESSRVAALRDNLHKIEDGVTRLPESLELRLGNKCNLKCMSCWSLSSSSIFHERETALKEMNLPDGLAFGWRWEIEEVKSMDKNWYESEIFKENFRKMAPQLRRLYLTGGEPTLIDENNFFMDELIKAGNPFCAVSFTTNATIWNEKFYKSLEKFQSSEVQISIDGIGSLNEYVRYGSKWEIVERNLEKIFALPESVNIKVFTVVSLLNAPGLTDIVRYLLEKFPKRKFIYAPIILQSPAYLSARLLSRDYRREVCDGIVEFLKVNEDTSHAWFRDGLRRVSDFLVNEGEGSEVDDREMQITFVKQYIDTLDQIRKNKHPQHQDLFERGLNGI